MSKPIPRTGASALTDSELLILDMAATQGGSRQFYHPENFSTQFNHPSHGLSPKQLIETLDRFERDGLISGNEFVDQWGEVDREVVATQKGGELWEIERNPDWSRHLSCRYGGQDGNDRNRIKIYGYSRQICQAYFEAARDSGILDYRGGRTRYAVGKRQLIRWRPSQTVYLLSAWLESWSCRGDWSHLEMKRCWWYSPGEISKLWGWPPAPMDA